MRDRPHWSYSAINQYLRCPLQYFFQRVLGLPSRTTASGLILGSAVHAALAHYHRRLQLKEEIQANGVLETFRETWADRETHENIVFKDGDTRDDSIGQGVQLLETYLKQPPPTGIVAVEQEILAPLYNSHGEYLENPLLAITDLIKVEDGTLTVNEFKTSGRAYSESDVTTSLQPTCYGHAVHETYGKEAAIEYTILVKTKTPKVQRLKTARTPKDFARLGDLVQTVEKAVNVGVFYPVENAMNCSGCSFRHQCREWGTRPAREEALVEIQLPAEAVACSQN